MIFVLLLLLTAPLAAAPADWVPVRWPWTAPESLELLKDSPVNCLLIDWAGSEPARPLLAEARKRGVVTLAVVYPKSEPVQASRDAIEAGFQGIVLEGDFPDDGAAKVRKALDGRKATVIELTSRLHMRMGSAAEVLGTYQGVWPGIQILADGTAKGGPTGSPWIDTNTGFLRAAHAWSNATIWIANRPPEKVVVTTRRYLQVISDAAMSGGRWVVALDPDLTARLDKREPDAMKTWAGISGLLRFLESHKEWRGLRTSGKLLVIQNADSGSLLSGGILDMIAVKHTPVRPVTTDRLNADSLKDVTMAVNVDPSALSDEDKALLRSFTRGGGTLLSGPPGWKQDFKPDQVTLDEKQLLRINDIWKEVNQMIGRSNLGARLFNVSTMLSNLLSEPGSEAVTVHLVNYSEYPVEWVAVHTLGQYKNVRLYTPEGGEKSLEPYKTDEGGTGVDIPSLSVWATLRLN